MRLPSRAPLLPLLLLATQLTTMPSCGGAADPAGAPTSALTGVALPAGTVADTGMLNRAAARTSMEMAAREAGSTLAEGVEIYRVPSAAGAVAPALMQAFHAQGWTVTLVGQGKEPWAWIEKGGRRFMAYVLESPSDPWLYFAPAGAEALRSAASAPASGDRAQPLAPAAPSSAPQPSPQPAQSVQQPAPPAANSARPAASRFAFTTTNFDDGWVATDQADHVFVRKGALACYLFHRITMTEQMRPPVINVKDYFWRKDVQPRFDVQTVDERRQDLGFSPTEYLEGSATDRATGQRVYVGMNVSRNSGGALNIVVVAPDRATFLGLFPKPDDLERMLTYNKFAVAPADLVGHWSESSSAYAQMYYVQSGNYAGMSGAAVSAEFWVDGNGTYRSQHKGASGMVGNQRVFQQEYKGRWAMNGHWEVSMTDRFNGKTDTFLAQFESVHGGRILHLTDKSAPGVQYHLGLAR